VCDILFGMAEHMIGAAIRSARVSRGLSLRRLAGALDVSPATVSAIETGRTEVTVARLRRIAGLLEVSTTDLLHAAPPPSAPPPQQIAQQWRSFDPVNLDPVLLAASRVFVRRGFHAATMREVADEAGLSVAGVYHHHPSKTGMLAALLDLTMAEIRWRLLAARADGASEAESFALMVEALALFHAHRGDLAFLGASEMRGLDPDDRTRITALRDDVQHLLDDQAARAIAAGELSTRDPRTATRAIATLCTSLPSWFRPDGELAADQVARQYAEYAIALMRAG
jgi:AcrR family transcriptional regulator/transcriptional regulator with XRE-family HTH domain